MRIVIVTEYFPSSAKGEITGGVEARAFFVARELAKRHQVTVVCSRRPGQRKKDSYLNIKVERVGPVYEYTPTGHLIKRVIFGFAAISKARRLCRANFDVIDGYSYLCYPAAILASKKTRRFLTYHEVWLDSWKKNTLRFAGILGELAERIVLWLTKITGIRVISVSGFTKGRLEEHGILPDKISVVANGVNLERFKLKVGKKFKHPTICYVGRLVEHKRVDDLINAFVIVRRKVKDLKLIIVGDGSAKTKLELLVKKLGLSEHIEITGYFKSYDEVVIALKKSHVFCSPSVVEGFGITVVEAAASGVPFVISDIEPFREVSKGGKGGLLFRQRDIADLAKKLEMLLKDKKLYERCKKEGKKLASEYGWQEIAKKIEEVYTQ
ncbi:glycosyltransferase family 4 protein [Candidatus Woesearchaeota archaeon]|nr:glycosyltransferase family 4 protein [Candidatus Woesearchaeota archaeon]